MNFLYGFALIKVAPEIALPNPGATHWQYWIYLGAHLVSIGIVVAILYKTMLARPSKAQTAVVSFDVGAIMYTLGFIQEILSDTPEGGYIACITQYCGEFVIFISTVYFVSQLCAIKLPHLVYMIMVLISALCMVCLMSTRSTRLFYKSIGVNDEGLFSRPAIDHNCVFYIVILFFFVCSCWILYACIKSFKHASPLQKKRLALIMFSCFFCWLPWILTLLGFTGGYEVPALGITFAGVCIYLCFTRYGFFDSQSLAGSNAMDRGKEGILVADSRFRLRYQNKKVYDIFGFIQENYCLTDHPILGKALKGELKKYEKDDKVYEFYCEPLMEENFIVSYMLWIDDATQHYEAIKNIENAATHDSLTGLYNRTQFQFLVEKDLNQGKPGTFVIFDMDNFKGVNDNYGHQVGDAVLKLFAGVLKKYGEQRLYPCRLGGDEFCIFLRNVTGTKEISDVLTKIFNFFDEALEKEGYGGYTSLSAGAATNIGRDSYKLLYNQADDRLYIAKTSGKKQFLIAE